MTHLLNLPIEVITAQRNNLLGLLAECAGHLPNGDLAERVSRVVISARNFRGDPSIPEAVNDSARH